jgi:lycopene cyclase domain-containing protein
MNYLYLLIDGLTVAFPLILSFDKRVAFYKSWKFLFSAILGMMVFFIPWDIAFTNYEVWGFNKAYLSGVYLFNLPIEEVLFFFVVPYACLFIYSCVNSYMKKDWFASTWRPICLIVSITLIGVGVWKYNLLYTSITFTTTGTFVLFHVLNKTSWFSRFLMAYVISLVPFVLVNGALTGTWIENEIVHYNVDHILNIRIETIPIEDIVYSMLMLGVTASFFEYFTKKSEKLR